MRNEYYICTYRVSRIFCPIGSYKTADWVNYGTRCIMQVYGEAKLSDMTLNVLTMDSLMSGAGDFKVTFFLHAKQPQQFNFSYRRRLSVHPSYTGCSLYIVCFPQNVVIFWTLQVLLQRLYSTCHLAGGPSIKFGVQPQPPRENRERPESGIYFKIFEKQNI